MLRHIQVWIFRIEREPWQRHRREGRQVDRIVLDDVLGEDGAAEIEVLIERGEFDAAGKVDFECLEIYRQPVLLRRPRRHRAVHGVGVGDRYRTSHR